MGRLVKFEVTEMPKTYVIGKELIQNMESLMQGNNQIPDLWQKCMGDDTFIKLREQKDYIYDDATVGVMTGWDKGDGNFSYICGMLMKDGANVPNGYVIHELEATKVCISQIKGKNVGDVCSNAHELTDERLNKDGFISKNAKWSMELYNCPRFTVPDENGEIILDYYIPLD